MRIMVTFTPGGPTDIQGRMLGEKLGQRLGQQFIIGAYLRAESAKFGKLVEAAGIKAAAGG